MSFPKDQTILLPELTADDIKSLYEGADEDRLEFKNKSQYNYKDYYDNERI